jgi:hypothetical protein
MALLMVMMGWASYAVWLWHWVEAGDAHGHGLKVDAMHVFLNAD